MTNLNFSKMTQDERKASYIFPKSVTIAGLSVSLSAISPNTTCLSLVPYDSNLGSTIGYKLSNATRSSLFLPPIILEILVGILLGDGHIRSQNPGGNPCVNHKQGVLHLEYSL
jgi:hypothetical protein